MKTRFLFPHKWRVTGLILFIIGFITFVIDQGYFFDVISWLHKHPIITGIDMQVIFDDFEYLTVIIGLLLIGFSKEKLEDEQIAQLRLDSLQWAIYVNYGIFIICIIFINGGAFLSVVAYSIVTPIIFFIIRFRWKIYQLNRALKLA
jgi:hypothetical protein